MKITISTFNVQNDIRNYSKKKSKIILQYLQKNHIDILNLQEVYSSLNKDLEEELFALSYSLYGKYRFLLKHLFNRINEKTPIITKYPVTKTRTYDLPFLPSLLKRVMTKVEITIDHHSISVYNTHLDFQREIVKKRQLKRIVKILKKDKNPIILTGDFNLKTNKQIFKDFIKELQKLHIKHIDIKEKTFKTSQYHRAIDHVFASEEFQVIDKKLITDIPTSDHYPILVEMEYHE